jgi:hypothetical protein
MNWLPKDVRTNAVYFREEILIPISQKLRTNVSGRHESRTRAHMDNEKVDAAKVASSVMSDLRLKRTPQDSPDICPSDVFLLVG